MSYKTITKPFEVFSKMADVTMEIKRPDRKTITLTREDLSTTNKSKDIEEIGLYDFYNLSVTIKQIEEANYIEFKDGDKVKVFKDK